MLDFHSLEMKYGSPAAYSLLLEMERVARIPSRDWVHFDPETRLANALHIQDVIAAELRRVELALQSAA